MPQERTATIVLEFPVQLADRELTELTMRRPTVEEEVTLSPASSNIREASAQELKYFAKLCDMKAEEFGKIDLKDYRKVQKQYVSFSEGSKDD